MAVRLYAMTLTRKGRSTGLPKFLAGVDLDADGYADVKLRMLMRAAIERSGGNPADIAEYELELRERSRDVLVAVYATYGDVTR